MDVNFPELLEVKKSLDSFLMVAGEIMARVGVNTTVTVKDIAKIEGTSLSQIRSGKEKYLLPSFGKSEYPDGVTRWSIDTFMKWREIPVEERKRAYLKSLQH